MQISQVSLGLRVPLRTVKTDNLGFRFYHSLISRLGKYQGFSPLTTARRLSLVTSFHPSILRHSPAKRRFLSDWNLDFPAVDSELFQFPIDHDIASTETAVLQVAPDMEVQDLAIESSTDLATVAVAQSELLKRNRRSLPSKSSRGKLPRSSTLPGQRTIPAQAPQETASGKNQTVRTDLVQARASLPSQIHAKSGELSNRLNDRLEPSQQDFEPPPPQRSSEVLTSPSADDVALLPEPTISTELSQLEQIQQREENQPSFNLLNPEAQKNTSIQKIEQSQSRLKKTRSKKNKSLDRPKIELSVDSVEEELATPNVVQDNQLTQNLDTLQPYTANPRSKKKSLDRPKIELSVDSVEKELATPNVVQDNQLTQNSDTLQPYIANPQLNDSKSPSLAEKGYLQPITLKGLPITLKGLPTASKLNITAPNTRFLAAADTAEKKADSEHPAVNQRFTQLEATLPQGYSVGGQVFASDASSKPIGVSDTVPAMLTPGEFVVNAIATQKHLPLLQQINQGDLETAAPRMQEAASPESENPPEVKADLPHASSTQFDAGTLPKLISSTRRHLKLSQLKTLQSSVFQEFDPEYSQSANAYQLPVAVFRSQPSMHSSVASRNAPTEWTSIEELLQVTSDPSELGMNFEQRDENSIPLQSLPAPSSAMSHGDAAPNARTQSAAETIEQSSSDKTDKTTEGAIEALAQEIYLRLHQRLAVERERQGHSHHLRW